MPVYLISIGLLFVFFVLYLKRANSQKRLAMPFWLLMSYTFLLLTHLFSGITYHVGNIWRILPYVILCLFLMLVGNAIGRRFKYNNSTPKIGLTHKTITFVAIFGAILLVFDFFRLNDIALGFRIPNAQISVIGVVGNIFASLGIIVWLYSIHNFIIFGIKLSIYTFLSFLSYVVYPLLTAGRQAFILIILSSIIMIIWGVKRRRELGVKSKLKISRRVKFGFILLCSLFIGYFSLISAKRSRAVSLEHNISMKESYFNGTVSDKTKSVMRTMGPLASIYHEALFYYSNEFIHLDLIYQDYNYPPLMGLEQLAYVERRIKWITGDFRDKALEHHEYVLEKKNRYTAHSWGTFLVDFIMDFGRLGALFACLISGIIFGVTYRSLKGQNTTEKIIRQCLMLAGIIFSIQFSPFAELVWTFPLLLIFFIKIKDTRKYVN